MSVAGGSAPAAVRWANEVDWPVAEWRGAVASAVRREQQRCCCWPLSPRPRERSTEREAVCAWRACAFEQLWPQCAAAAHPQSARHRRLRQRRRAQRQRQSSTQLWWELWRPEQLALGPQVPPSRKRPPPPPPLPPPRPNCRPQRRVGRLQSECAHWPRRPPRQNPSHRLRSFFSFAECVAAAAAARPPWRRMGKSGGRRAADGQRRVGCGRQARRVWWESGRRCWQHSGMIEQHSASSM